MADGLRVNPGLLNRGGRGVQDGRPYGEQLHDEREDMQQQWGLLPNTRDRLRAATRKAFKRG